MDDDIYVSEKVAQRLESVGLGMCLSVEMFGDYRLVAPWMHGVLWSAWLPGGAGSGAAVHAPEEYAWYIHYPAAFEWARLATWGERPHLLARVQLGEPWDSVHGELPW